MGSLSEEAIVPLDWVALLASPNYVLRKCHCTRKHLVQHLKKN
jgi:hypothetical protein